MKSICDILVYMRNHNVNPKYVFKQNMAENKITPICAASLGSVIEDTTWLTHLNLSGNVLILCKVIA